MAAVAQTWACVLLLAATFAVCVNCRYLPEHSKLFLSIHSVNDHRWRLAIESCTHWPSYLFTGTTILLTPNQTTPSHTPFSCYSLALRYLRSLTWENRVRVTWRGHTTIFPTEDQGPRFTGADCHQPLHTGCKPFHCMLEVMDRWRQQNHTIGKKQGCSSKIPIPDTFLIPAWDLDLEITSMNITSKLYGGVKYSLKYVWLCAE